jgi:hypothetical protein
MLLFGSFSNVVLRRHCELSRRELSRFIQNRRKGCIYVHSSVSQKSIKKHISICLRRIPPLLSYCAFWVRVCQKHVGAKYQITITRQLLTDWDKVEMLAAGIIKVIMTGKETGFSEVCDLITKAGVPSLRNSKGYWVVHLCRAVMPSFSGVGIPGKPVHFKHKHNGNTHKQ